MAARSPIFPVPVPLFIQNSLFGLGQLEVLEGGYNSDVLLLSHSRQVIIKVIGNKKGLDLTTKEAVKLGQRISRYRSLLSGEGVKVPGFLEWAVTQDSETGRVYLFVIEPFSGHDPRRLLLSGDYPNCMHVTGKLLEAAEPLLCRKEESFLPVGLDPKTANFVIPSESEACVYVDFMPPRYRLEDGTYLVEYPQIREPKQVDLWKWKYFTLEGLITIALYQLGRLCARLFQEIKKKARTWLLERRLLKVLGYLDFLESVTPGRLQDVTNPYHLRLLMCELASRPGANVPDTVVEDFFLKTHFEGELSRAVLFWSQRQLSAIASTVS